MAGRARPQRSANPGARESAGYAPTMRSEGRRTSSGATEKGAPFFVSEPVGGALAHSDECERREGRKAMEIARRWGKGAQAGRDERSPLANEERPNDSTDTN